MITNIVLIISTLILAFFQLKYPNSAKEEISKKELMIMSVLFFALTFAFLGFTGVLTSGYHFVDDHEVYFWGNKFSQNGFFPSMFAIIKNDLNIRYRITYIIIRVTQCYIFKDNFVAWQVFYAVVIAASLCMAYYYSRIRTASMLASFAFAMAIFLGGDQIAVTWRLGPPENLSVMFLFITLLSLRYYYKKRNIQSLITAVISTLLLSGSKESFLLLLPTLPMILIYWDMETEDDYSLKKLFRLIHKNFAYICSTLVIFFGGILVIYLVVGTNQIGYAGVDSGFKLIDYLREFYWIVRGDILVYLVLAFITGIFAIYCQKDNISKLLRASFWPVIMLIVNMSLQFVLHAKSGMYERYLLPSTIILAYFAFVYCEKYIRHRIVLFTIFAAMIFLSNDNQADATMFAKDGTTTNAILKKVSELYTDGDKILVDLGYEKDSSTEICLEERYGIPTVYNVNHTPSDDGLFYDSYHPSTAESTPISIDEANMIIRYKNNSEEILQIDNLDKDYSLYEFGRYLLYVK